jgi:hypothetical protein
MTTLRFRAQIEINKINPYVLVDARRAARLQKNWRKPMPVCIQVNGKPDQPWRINMMPIGDGSFYLYLHGTVRKLRAPRSAMLSASWCGLMKTTAAGPPIRCHPGLAQNSNEISAPGIAGTRSAPAGKKKSSAILPP